MSFRDLVEPTEVLDKTRSAHERNKELRKRGLRHTQDAIIPTSESQLDEAHKLGDKVTIVGGPTDLRGKEGYIGEIRHGLHKKAPKYYTIDHDKGSAQLRKEDFRKSKSLDEGFVVKDHTGKPVFAHGADTIAKKKAEELTASTGNKHTVEFDREAHQGSIKEATSRRVEEPKPKTYHVQCMGVHSPNLRVKTNVSAFSKEEALSKAKESLDRGGYKKGTHYTHLHAAVLESKGEEWSDGVGPIGPFHPRDLELVAKAKAERKKSVFRKAIDKIKRTALPENVMSFRELIEGQLSEGEYSFLRKSGFKKSGTMSDGGDVHTHPANGSVIINKHGEWHHVPHGSSREDGFEGTTGETLKAHLGRLNEGQLDELSRSGLSTYIRAATHRDDGKDRSKGIKLAQLKKWGDKNYGLPEPKVKATEESIKENIMESESVLHKVASMHAVAGDALSHALDYPEKSTEHHKWMTVHHQAQRHISGLLGDHRSEGVHEMKLEQHAMHANSFADEDRDHSSIEDFHDGSSHHWDAFHRNRR
jgi:hypothetical protein